MAVTDDPTRKNSGANDQSADQELESVGMEDLLRIYDERIAEFTEGDIVRGRVLKVRTGEAVIDIGYKSEGIVPIHEVTASDGTIEVKQGDELDVAIERLEDSSGYVLLSREKARRIAAWDELESAHREERVVTGKILDRVKGGLAVELGGVRAFLPGSLVDVRPVRNLESFRGQESEFRIVSLDRKRNNIVLSRKAVLEVEHNKKKSETFARIREGDVTHGVVKNITDYGAFVDLGGVDGLLHITDISWGRINHPSEVFNVGDEIDVVVLKFDPEHERVSLGYKQRRQDPWSDVDVRYPIGSKVSGRVVSLTDYGAFVELEEGVEGLIHISEMSWTRRIRPSKILKQGDIVETVVADVNSQARRISLSLRALESNPWHTIAERYPVGATVSGRVRNLTDFGAFVEVEEGIDGLIHISDMSWTRRLHHPSEVVKKGDVVTARVISIDPDAQRLSLSIKEFVPNEWDDFAERVHVGEEVLGEVAKITDFGLFVRLAEGIEGLAHVSEVDRPGRAKLEEVFQPGDIIRVRIIRLDPTEHRIGLSLRDVAQPDESEIEEFRRAEASRTAAAEAEPAAQQEEPPASGSSSDAAGETAGAEIETAATTEDPETGAGESDET